MASYNELNALIDAYINRNGVQAITGQILNGVLKAMVEQLGRGYSIMGAATPATDPGTPDGPECYFASEVGTYTDFDGLQIVPGELALLCYTPSGGWTKETIYEGFQEVEATIDGNVGTPSVGVSYANGVLSFDFRNMKGNPGDPAGFGTIGADITGGVGTPGVTVESSGPATAKNLQFHFTNLKGETGVTSVVATIDNTSGTPTCTVSLVGQQLTLAFSGLKGAQGNTGSSVDYPFTIVNNLTTNDATQALSAAMGVQLEAEVSQLEAKVNDLTGRVSIVGNGNTGVTAQADFLKPGHFYRAWIKSWPFSLVTSNQAYLLFYVNCKDASDNSNYVESSVSCPGSAYISNYALPPYIDFKVAENATTVLVGGRLNSGATGIVDFQEIPGLPEKETIPLRTGNISLDSITIVGDTSARNIFLPVHEGEQYFYKGRSGGTSKNRSVAFYNSQKQMVYLYDVNNSGNINERLFYIPAGVSYIAFNFMHYADGDGFYKIGGDYFVSNSISGLMIKNPGAANWGTTFPLNVIPGHRYRAIPKSWPADLVTAASSNTQFGIYDGDTRISNRVTFCGGEMYDYYDFTVPENPGVIAIRGRLNLGEFGEVYIRDITGEEQNHTIAESMAIFMDAVQRKSENIGLTSSTWNNPYGGRLYGFNRTTVKDLLKATIYASGNPRLMDIMGATETKVRVWGEHARVSTITNDIPEQLATYYQTLHGTVMPYKILANKAGAHANEATLADNGFSLLVVAIVSGHYVAAVVGIGNTSQGYTDGRNNRKKGMVELLDIVAAYYSGQSISGMSVTSCEKAIAAELPSNEFPQCFRKDSITPIFSQDPDTVFMPASTSKVMAAVTMLDFLEMGEFHTILGDANELVNDSDYTAYEGDIQTVETSFYAMMMASNGANTLALGRIAGEKILNGLYKQSPK